MKFRKYLLSLISCLIIVSCTRIEVKNESAIVLEVNSNFSFELIENYDHPDYYWPEYSIGYADILLDGSLVFDVSKNGTGKFINTYIYKALTAKSTTEFPNKKIVEYSFINIDHNLHLIDPGNNSEYILYKDAERIKKIKVVSKRKIIDNIYLLYRNYRCSIVKGKTELFASNNNSFVVPTKFYTVGNNEMLFMYVRNDVGYNSNRELIALNADGNYSVLRKDIRDFTKVGNYIICLDSFAPPGVPQIPQEEAWEEYSINVYDLDGKLIKNLDKELYDAYGLLAFPDSISVNGNGYGVMSGSFVFNYGKENEYDFRGLVIFRLVESK